MYIRVWRRKIPGTNDCNCRTCLLYHLQLSPLWVPLFSHHYSLTPSSRDSPPLRTSPFLLSPFSFLLSLPLPHLIFCPNPPHPTYPHFSFRLFLSFPPFPFKPNSREFFFLNTWAAIEVTYILVPQENKSFHKIFPFFLVWKWRSKFLYGKKIIFLIFIVLIII